AVACGGPAGGARGACPGRRRAERCGVRAGLRLRLLRARALRAGALTRAREVKHLSALVLGGGWLLTSRILVFGRQSRLGRGSRFRCRRLDALRTGSARERINIARAVLFGSALLRRACRASLRRRALAGGLGIRRRGTGLLRLGRLRASGLGCCSLRGIALGRLNLSGGWSLGITGSRLGLGRSLRRRVSLRSRLLICGSNAVLLGLSRWGSRRLWGDLSGRLRGCALVNWHIDIGVRFRCAVV